MFCIDNRCTDVYFNLAVEEYLLKQTQGDYFVIWQSEPSVVMGKNQSVRAEVNEDYRIEKGIRLARRFSGGGAVYHDKGNINLTFIETTSQPLFEDYLQRIVGFLETMGVTAYTDERLGIYLDGKKISGSAQCIHKNRVMYHCTLLFSANLDVLHTVLKGKSDGAMGKNQSVRAEVNEDYRIEKGIRLARRFSGGGAVYHDKGNINLTFIETTSQPLFEDYLQRIVGFLETMGVTAYTDERLGIYLDGKKISGSAQCIHKNRVMYHCTLLFSANLDVLHTVLKGKSDELESIPGLKNIRAVPSVPSEVVNLNCFLDVSVNIKRFIHLLFHYFLIEDEKNSIYHFSRKDLAAIELLKVEKYANEDWIHHRVTLKKI